MTPTLNIDLGEHAGEPEALYALAQVVNVACGGHAGDEASMRLAVSLALAHRALVAAHPSYPDRESFGRASLAISPEALEASVAAQCRTLARVAEALGVTVARLKPHGALYHDASRSPALAGALVRGALEGLGAAPAQLSLVGPPSGELFAQAKARGLGYLREGFADRGYAPGGALVARGLPGALLTHPADAARQARALAAGARFDTLCVHGDTPGAVAIARAVREALDALDPGER